MSNEFSIDVDFVLDTKLMKLDGKTSQRKIRLFGCACVRRNWPMLTQMYRRSVELAEQFADGKVSHSDLLQAWSKAERVAISKYKQKCARAAASWCVRPQINAGGTARSIAGFSAQVAADWESERTIQLKYFQDIFFDSTSKYESELQFPCKDETVKRIAIAAYDSQQSPRGELDGHVFGALADALEEAGCTIDEVLNHCRGNEPHVRGCWLLDCILKFK